MRKSLAILQSAAFVVVVSIGLLAIHALPVTATSHLSYDGIRYLAGAESILSTGEYRSFTGLADSHLPPGTSLLYAAVARLAHRSPESLVLPINLCAFALLGIALYVMLATLRLSFPLRLLACSAVLLNSSVFSMYGKLWSEPLFLPLWIIFLAAVIGALSEITASQPVRANALLGIAAFALGMAYVFRYAAVFGIAVLVSVAVLRVMRDRRSALTLAPIVAAGFLLPVVVAWRLAGMADHSRAPRHISGLVTPIRVVLSHMIDGFRLVADQLIPIKRFGTPAVLLGGVVLVVLPLVFSALHFDRPLAQANIALIAAFIGYFAFIAFVQTFVDPATPFDLRILSPLVAVFVASLAADCELLRTPDTSWPRRAAALFFFTLLVVASARSGRAAFDTLVARSGRPSATRPDDRISLIRDLRIAASSVPPSATLFSNTPALVWYALRRKVLPLDHVALREEAPAQSIALITRSDDSGDLSWDASAPAAVPNNLAGRTLYSSERVRVIGIQHRF